MKPVYQDKFTATDGWNKGNCAAACVASIFELDLAKTTKEIGYPTPDALWTWTERSLPGLSFRNVDLAHNYRLIGNWYTGLKWTYDLPDAWEPPTEGYWMATVFSHGVTRPLWDPYWPLPGLHAVVMRGRQIVHNPNPHYPLALTSLVMLNWWVELEEVPAKCPECGAAVQATGPDPAEPWGWACSNTACGAWTCWVYG